MPSTIYGYLGLLRQEGSVGSLYPIRSSKCMIGRDSNCSVRIHKVYISDQHCIIRSRSDKESMLQNLSTNSCTLLNGMSLEDTSDVLRHGDVITLGERNFVWQYPESSKFWCNPESRYLKISPTTFPPKKTVSLPSKIVQHKVSSTRTNLVKVVSTSSSARRHSQTVSSKPIPGVFLKKASSQSKLSSSSPSSFTADWPSVTPAHENNLTRKKSRATSANFLMATSKNLEFPSKTPERKRSSFTTLAPNMMASLQKKVSEMGLDELGASSSKFPHIIYGQLAILRPNGAVGSRLPLSTEECTVGRGLECSIRIALSTVSDKQCLISSKRNQESTITNLSKVSSTLLNGKNLGEGTTKLCHGDVITMAERSFRWEYPTSSPLWKKQPDGNANTKVNRPNQQDKNNPASLGSKSQKRLVTMDGRRVASPSKSSLLKTSSVMAPQLTRKNTSKTSFTSKTPAPANTSNSLLAHLNPEQTSHISMKHASLLKTPPNKNGTIKKSPPFPFLKSMPELSKNGPNATPKSTARKVLSFNGPTPNPKMLPTGKSSDKRNGRVAARKPTPARLNRSRSSVPELTPRVVSSRDSSCEESLSSPPPAEGSQSVNKISPSLFKGYCFTSSTEKRPTATKVVERPDSSLTVPSMRDDEDELSNTTGLIDPIYYSNH